MVYLGGCGYRPDGAGPASAAPTTASPSAVAPLDCTPRPSSESGDDSGRTPTFHATPGQLPAPDAGEVGGVAIPRGQLVKNADGVAVAWLGTDVLSEDRLIGLIRDLAGVFSRTGLWPIRVPTQYRDDAVLDPPWLETGPERSLAAIPTAPAVYERICRDYARHSADLEPLVPPVTALARRQPGPEMMPSGLRIAKGGGLLLVPVARPADVPAVLGWLGATNTQLTGADITAVLRSWEDRFEAVLVSIGFDTLEVQVGNRPESAQQRGKLVSEHYWICPDNFAASMPDYYSQGLSTWTRWSFWWD